MDELQEPPSIRTWKVAPPSLSEKPKLTFGPLVDEAAGPLSIDGAGGGVVSTANEREPENADAAVVLSVPFACQ